jgi:hypothetical protein
MGLDLTTVIIQMMCQSPVVHEVHVSILYVQAIQ